LNKEEKISVTVVTYNEEKNIDRCLKSVNWADEIIVVDSFSTDRTVDICRQYTDKVIQHKWEGYIKQKNYAVKHAKFDWILAIDADEEISPALKEEIEKLKTTGFTKNGYKIPRKVYYLGKWIKHGGWYPDYKIRLFDRQRGQWGGIDPHDEIQLQGACGRLKNDLFHYSYEDLRAHINQINSFTSISAQEFAKKGKRALMLNILFNPFFKFLKAYILKLGFLEGRVGFFISILGSFYVFLKYLKLWELDQFGQKIES
jgi:glycosyltransferase involved in cell wall biosynthesis